MGIETIVAPEIEVKKEIEPGIVDKINNQLYSANKEDLIFCQQYLEKPIVSGDYKMEISLTACTIKGIPVVDDF